MLYYYYYYYYLPLGIRKIGLYTFEVDVVR